MRLVRIGRSVLNHDAKPTGLEDAITLTGAEPEEMRRHLDAFGVRPWRPGPVRWQRRGINSCLIESQFFQDRPAPSKLYREIGQDGG